MSHCRVNQQPIPRRQCGVALITVMLVVFIATVIATELATRVNFHIQRASHQHAQAQAYQFALGGEELIRQLLYQDNEKTSYDHLNESWSALEPQYAFEQGQLTIKVQDLHARLNINNLLNNKSKINNEVFQQFQRLFELLSLEPSLLSVLVDWLDKDTTPIAQDSEDSGYLSLEKPYRAANAPLVHLSELALLKGWDHDTVTTLAPFITALPEKTLINVNTAPAEVLAALVKGLPLLGAESLVASRGKDGFDTMDAFVTHSSLAGLEVKTTQATINSAYFALYTESQFAGRTIKLQTRLHRNPTNGKIRLISRDRSSKYLWPEATAE
jgi:general secretion pathway protein K